MFSRDSGHFRGVTQVVNAHNKHVGETYMPGRRRKDATTWRWCGLSDIAVVRAAASAYRTMRISTSPSRSGSTCSVPSAVNPFFS